MVPNVSFYCVQCAAHLNLGWRITVMANSGPVPTTEPDITINTQPATDGEIIGATTAREIGESTTTTTTTTDGDEEPRIGTDFDQFSMGGAMTVSIFFLGLIAAVAFAILISE